MGRQHMGERDFIAARPPKPVADAARARAAERGVSLSQYVSALMATDVGLPDAVPLPDVPDSPQPRLPLVG